MTDGFVTPDAGGHYLAELLGTPFSDEQLAVITAPLGPQLVIAGAGSGKTTVVAARVVHAVAFHGVAPSAVLGLTFTNKAASELGERVRRALNRLAAARATEEPALAGAGPAPRDRPEHEPSLRGATAGNLAVDDMPTVSTYHAYAALIVADNALRIGREPQNRLLTEAARWQVAMRVARNAKGPFEFLRWTTPFVAQYVLDLDGEMSEHLVGIDDVRGANARIRAQVAGSGDTTVAVREVALAASERDELLQLVSAYRDRKRSLDAVDFGDQVALAARIAEACEPVAAAERTRYAVVFLDEYQDTGVSQRRMLAALFGGGHPVTAVGDPSQSIYGWRGASAGNLLRFPEHFATADGGRCRPQFLLTSFRNGSRILRAANALSAPLRAATPDRPILVEVPELAAAPAAAAGMLRVALHVTVEDEAEWLADQVAAELAAGRAPRDIAVLCRRRTDFDLFHRTLVARDVPVEVVGLAGLLMMPEVSDVVAVLQAIADPTANAALVRILTGPRWRIGPRDLAALGRRAAALCDTGRSHVSVADDPDGAAALADATASVDPCDVVALSDALAEIGDPTAFSTEAVHRFGALAAELARLRRLGGHPVVDIVSRVVSAIGLDVEIEASPTRVAAARAANLAAFADHAARFESVDGESDLPAFLSYLAAAETAENGLDVGAVSTADTVKLLTVHKAKGLEWDVVAVPCLADKTFPSGQSRSRWTKAAAVLPFGLRGDREDLPSDPDLTTKGIAAFKLRCREQELSEERRLAYVAVTRAKSLLLASGHRWSATRTEVSAISPYLEELAEVAADGGGEIATWAVDVPEVNPLLARIAPDVQWPAAYDESALARRRDAAAIVEAALTEAALTEAALTEAALTEAALTEAAPVVAQAVEWDPAGLSAAERHLVTSWAEDADKLLEELARDLSGTREVALPRTLTASQVVALAASADEFAADLARPMPRRPSSAARRGTAFHAWVEHRFEARPLFDPDDLPGAGDDDTPFGDDELDALREAFAASPFGDRRPYAIEAPFELNVGGRLVRGRIDAVYETADGFDVVDYKTGLKPRDMAAAAWQLAVYRLAWAGLAGVPVENVGAAFLYVRTGDVVRPELLDADGLERLLSGDAFDVHEAGPAAPEPAAPEPAAPEPAAPEPAAPEPAAPESAAPESAAPETDRAVEVVPAAARAGAVSTPKGKQPKPVDEDQLALDW